MFDLSEKIETQGFVGRKWNMGTEHSYVPVWVGGQMRLGFIAGAFAKHWKLIVVGAGCVMIYQACGQGFKSFDNSSTFLGSRSSGDIKDPDVFKACGQIEPTFAPIHRLSNTEYNNTVRDLFYVDIKPAESFPTSPMGKTGFSNESITLGISQDLVFRYNEAAVAIAAAVLETKGQAGGAYAKIAPCAPESGVGTSSNLNPEQCKLETIRKLATRAYRRPVREGGQDDELGRLIAVFDEAGSDFDLGLQDVIIAIALDPKFFLRVIENPYPNVEGAEYFVSEFELASRLSYFIWQSMPDQVLMDLAATGRLSETNVLRAQIRRMLADPKSDAFAKVLVDEWSPVARLAASEVGGLDESLREAMLKETELFFQYMVRQDASFLEVVSAEYTFVNQMLADYYGIPFPGQNPEEFVKVTVPPGRQGVITHAAALTATAGGTSSTHPVRRGLWAAKRILCVEPPPPPPDIPIIGEPEPGVSIREALLAHSQQPACIGCHRVMDNVGLGLENFDPFGQWRTSYSNDLTVDASGVLPSGTQFTGPEEMLEGLEGEPLTKACLAETMMSLAVNRKPAGVDDKCVAEVIGEHAITADSRLSELVERIVFSFQFRMQKNEE